MIPPLYRAAMEGQVEILNDYVNLFDVELTGNNNTVLHVAAQFGQLSCVESILRECRPSLLHTTNCKHETPLHIAAREGHLGTVEALVKRAKQVESEGQTIQDLLRSMNLDKDTALHLAVQNVQVEIVRLLTREDREFSYPANKAEETPLYLAVEREDYDMVVVILDNFSVSPFCSGPDGRTALHEAALLRKTPEIATKLLIWKPELIDKADANGWTPLHYAARCGNVQLVEKILEKNYLLAQVRTADEDGGKTALHIAAAVGKVTVMEKILSACPECWETVDCTGHNILHIAADMESERVLKFIFKMSWSSQLINQKDNKGNTPLHLLGALEVKGWESIMKYRGSSSIFNNENMSPEEVLLSQQFGNRQYGQIINGRNMLYRDHANLAKWKSVRTKRLEEMKKARENLDNEKIKSINEMAKTHVVVATLIATITFTASFTMPGGYDSNPGSEQGMPILLRKVTFKAFVITNAIALCCSTISVFLYCTASCYIHEYGRIARHASAFIFILISMVAMMVAFITGSYSVLPHSLSVPVAILGCIFFLIFYVELENALDTWEPYMLLISDSKKERISADRRGNLNSWLNSWRRVKLKDSTS